MWVVYQTKNNLNGRYYIGVNKVKTKEDALNNYYGSGILIKEAIKKYGKENFTKTILEYFDDEQSAYAFEKLVVKPIKDDPLSYNLIHGGKGGRGRVMSNEQKQNISKTHLGKTISSNQKLLLSKINIERYSNIEERVKTGNAIKNAFMKDPSIIDRISKSVKNTYDNNVNNVKERISEAVKLKANWKERPEYLEKMSLSRKNSKRYKCSLCNSDKSYDGGNFTKHCKNSHQLSFDEILRIKNSQ